MMRFLVILASCAFLVACTPLPAPLPLPFLHPVSFTPTVSANMPVSVANVYIQIGTQAINLRSSPELAHGTSNVIAWGIHDDTMRSTGICHAEVDADGNLIRFWVQVQYKKKIGWIVAFNSRHLYIQDDSVQWSDLCREYK